MHVNVVPESGSRVLGPHDSRSVTACSHRAHAPPLGHDHGRRSLQFSFATCTLFRTRFRRPTRIYKYVAPRRSAAAIAPISSADCLAGRRSVWRDFCSDLVDRRAPSHWFEITNTMAPTKKTTKTASAPRVAAPPRRVGRSKPPTEHDIASRAYELFLQRGGEHGRDLDDWLLARRELLPLDLEGAEDVGNDQEDTMEDALVRMQTEWMRDASAEADPALRRSGSGASRATSARLRLRRSSPAASWGRRLMARTCGTPSSAQAPAADCEPAEAQSHTDRCSSQRRQTRRRKPTDSEDISVGICRYRQICDLRVTGRVVIGDQAKTSREGSLLWTLEEIGRLISQSGNASETLTQHRPSDPAAVRDRRLLRLPAGARSREPRARGDDRPAP